MPKKELKPEVKKCVRDRGKDPAALGTTIVAP
jgi:hypothetical protein